MRLPIEILKAIDVALQSLEQDLQDRRSQGRDGGDLLMMRKELEEMKQGQRQQASQSLTRMIVDSMDWNQPCLRAFNLVSELLRKYYKTRP